MSSALWPPRPAKRGEGQGGARANLDGCASARRASPRGIACAAPSSRRPSSPPAIDRPRFGGQPHRGPAAPVTHETRPSASRDGEPARRRGPVAPTARAAGGAPGRWRNPGRPSGGSAVERARAPAASGVLPPGVPSTGRSRSPASMTAHRAGPVGCAPSPRGRIRPPPSTPACPARGRASLSRWYFALAYGKPAAAGRDSKSVSQNERTPT